MALDLPWTANRFALFNFNTKNSGGGGCADFTWFHFATNYVPANVIAVGPAKQFPHPDRIHYDGHCLTIDGKDTFILQRGVPLFPDAARTVARPFPENQGRWF